MQCREKLKVIASLSLFLFVSIIFAQETHNLEIIWQKASPDSVFAFGRCIASGDVNGENLSDIMIVGDSVLHSANPDSFYRGVCWIYLGGQDPDTIPDIRLSNLQKCTFFALHSCDINGDGLDDVILGACNNANAYGEVLIFLGGHHMDTICDYRIIGPQAGSGFGGAIASGDVNGDSFSDLIVGACGAAPMPGGYLMGQVYIYFGGPNFDIIPDVILNGGHQGDYELFGTSVGGGGDVNSDGYQDIIVGAANFGSSYNGRIYIYFGGSPPDTVADVAMIGEGPNQQLGWSKVDFLKNLNYFDYATASTSLWPRGVGYNPGKIYVLFGGNSMDSIPDIWMIGKHDSSRLGTSTSSAGDINGDSCDDIISGAPTEYDSKGIAYIWLGGTILDTIPDAWIRGDQYVGGIGWMVASVGDVNGDDKDEIMVSNYPVAVSPKKVWVCKYTGQGIEEKRQPLTARI
jgi:FG-GAP repeat